MRTTYMRRREQRRLGQLGICALLFTGVLIGKGIFPAGLDAVSTSAQDTQPEQSEQVSAFSDLGSSAFDNNSVWEAFEGLVVTVFGGADEVTAEAAPAPRGDTLSYQAERKALTTDSTAAVMQTHLELALTSEEVAAAQAQIDEAQVQTDETQAAQTTDEAQAAPVTDTATAAPQEEVVQAVAQAYTVSGEALPASVSLQYYALGLSNTVTPVKGTLSSEFGYRVHPISGSYAFHYGTDIAADIGTDIVAFADGTVEYIGKSDEYGLYIQIDHGSGVKTFYCHCSKLCASQGQTVTAGEKIAEVGSTGNSTGPHLHFEVKKDGIYLNAIYYINLS